MRAVVSAEDVERAGWPERTGRHGRGVTAPVCPRCGQNPVAVEVIVQARGTARTKPMAYYGTRSRRVCEPCGQELYAAMLVAMEVDA
jgi:hypothetical protein